MHERANAWSTGGGAAAATQSSSVIEWWSLWKRQSTGTVCDARCAQYCSDLGERERLDASAARTAGPWIPPRTASGTTACRSPPTSTTTAMSPTVVQQVVDHEVHEVGAPARPEHLLAVRATRSAPWGRRSGRAGRTPNTRFDRIASAVRKIAPVASVDANAGAADSGRDGRRVAEEEGRPGTCPHHRNTS